MVDWYDFSLRLFGWLLFGFVGFMIVYDIEKDFCFECQVSPCVVFVDMLGYLVMFVAAIFVLILLYRTFVYCEEDD